MRSLPDIDSRLMAALLSVLAPAAVLVGASLSKPASPLAWAAAAVLALWIVAVAVVARNVLLRHIRTLSNLVEAARLHDFSMRSARARHPDELGKLYQQINRLTESMMTERQGEHELIGLLDKIVNQIDVAIVVFGPDRRVRLANRRARILLKTEDLVGQDRAATALSTLAASSQPKLIDFRFPGAEGRWQIVEHSYRHQGQEGRVLFIADLQQVLVEEEIAAWQRLSRIVGHEVNNSLTPIISLCQTLANMTARGAGAHAEDIVEGLGVIGERAKGLQDFIAAYTRMARLPEANKALFPLADLAARLRRIFDGAALEIAAFPDAVLFGDIVHLEQALINLVKNGLEANVAGAPPVSVSCTLQDRRCEFVIADHGAGIGNQDNLFVPFYTTKSEGTGIGLVLCRQIAARHHGFVNLADRADGKSGAMATMVLPLPADPSPPTKTAPDR